MVSELLIAAKKQNTPISDGDILIHSIIDAILGAMRKKDIGTFFPSEDNILTFKNNPATSFKTFTDFNKLAKAEYKAALDAVKNDPTRKGAIRSWFNKRFGTC